MSEQISQKNRLYLHGSWTRSIDGKRIDAIEIPSLKHLTYGLRKPRIYIN